VEVGVGTVYFRTVLYCWMDL